jgi:hypothetical protein
MSKVKIKPIKFLQAAKLIQDELKKYPVKYSGYYEGCCSALYDVTQNDSSPEYKFFKKHFSNKRGEHIYWFGTPCKGVQLDGAAYEYARKPKIKNQQKRIKALMKAYKMTKGKK